MSICYFLLNKLENCRLNLTYFEPYVEENMYKVKTIPLFFCD
jgi:hypothetical protein